MSDINNDNNIEYLLFTKKVSKEYLLTHADYDLIKNHGYLILRNFGSDFYDELESIVIIQYIKNNDVNSINKIVSHSFLTKYKNAIIEKFGETYYNKMIQVYN